MDKELPALSDLLNDPRSKNFVMLVELTGGYWTPKQIYEGLVWIDEWEGEKAFPHLKSV